MGFQSYFSPTDCAPPIVAPFSHRNPPNVVFQRETVTMMAQLRHRSSSLSSRWRNDASQVICASDHDFLHDVQLPCLILRPPARKLPLFYQNAHSAAFTSVLKMFLYSSQSPLFRATKLLLHHSVRATNVIAAFNLLRVLFGWRFQLPLTLYSCLLFFCRLLSEPLYSLSLSWHKCSHIPRMYCSFPIIFPKPSTVRLLPRELSPLLICQCVSPFAF